MQVCYVSSETSKFPTDRKKIRNKTQINEFCIRILSLDRRTAAPYFSNLVWFIGKHILELDNCVRTDIE